MNDFNNPRNNLRKERKRAYVPSSTKAKARLRKARGMTEGYRSTKREESLLMSISRRPNTMNTAS
jgi:hypothetical protein